MSYVDDARLGKSICGLGVRRRPVLVLVACADGRDLRYTSLDRRGTSPAGAIGIGYPRNRHGIGRATASYRRRHRDAAGARCHEMRFYVEVVYRR